MPASPSAVRDPVRQYLQSIGRIPLLTHAQEIEYGRSIQTVNRLQQIKAELAEHLANEPDVETWAIAAELSPAALELALEQGQVAKQKMMEANLRLVVSVAKKYSKSGVDLLDLIQEGTIGLQRGVEKFDPSKGYRFSTYAYWWIRQGITRSIADKSRTIRLPIHITEKLNKIRRAQRELTQALGQTPSAKALATELQMTPQQIRSYCALMRQPMSLDLRVGEDNETALGDLIEDTEHNPEEFVTQHALSSDLERLIYSLNDQQRRVIRLRYGLNGEAPMTLAQIGEVLKVSRERVRQIERDALRNLRDRGGQFEAYLVS